MPGRFDNDIMAWVDDASRSVWSPELGWVSASGVVKKDNQYRYLEDSERESAREWLTKASRLGQGETAKPVSMPTPMPRPQPRIVPPAPPPAAMRSSFTPPNPMGNSGNLATNAPTWRDILSTLQGR